MAYVSFDVGNFKARQADVIGYYFEREAQREAALGRS